jgi:hypothetical protein
MKKVLLEEIKRIYEIMGIDKNPRLIYENVYPVTKNIIEDLVDFFKNKKRFSVDVPRSTPPKIKIGDIEIDKSYFERMSDEFDDLITGNKSWDEFLEVPSDSRLQKYWRDKIDLLSSLINNDATFQKKFYDELVLKFLNDFNANNIGGDVFETEQDFLRALYKRLNDPQNPQTLDEVLKSDGFDEFMVQTMKPSLQKRLDAIKKADQNTLDELTKDVVTDYVIDNTIGGFHPKRWEGDFNDPLLDNPEALEELRKLIDPNFIKNITDIAEVTTKQSEAIRKILARLSRPATTPEDIKLHRDLLETLDKKLKSFYSKRENDNYKYVEEYLNNISAKVTPNSDLGKVIKKIKEYPSTEEKIWALSLVDSTARNLFEAMIVGIKKIDWLESFKLIHKTTVKFLRWFGKDNWKKRMDDILKKYPESKFLNDTRLWGSIHGRVRNFDYWKKYYLRGRTLSARTEWFAEAYMRVIKLKLEIVFYKTILEALIYFSNGLLSKITKNDDAQRCKDELRGQLRQMGKGDNYDIMDGLEEGIFTSTTACEGVGVIDRISLDFMSRDDTNLLWATFVENFKQYVVPNLNPNEWSAVGIATNLWPGILDNVLYEVGRIVKNTTDPGGWQKVLEDIEVKTNEVIQDGQAAVDSLEQQVENSAAQADSAARDLLDLDNENTTNTTIDGSESGFKNYLKSIGKTYKESSFKEPVDGYDANGKDTEGNTYEFTDGKWE